MSTRSKVKLILKFQRACMKTNLDWIEFYDRYPRLALKPQYRDIVKTAGTRAHHERCVRGYEKTIALLESMA